jgi:uncharacterized membrane protein YedE/YeeE
MAAFAFGVMFVILMLGIAVFVPHPTPFQYGVFRSVLALAAAGVAAFIPGFISVALKSWLRAGGAIAVFVIVYFFSPANLVTQPQETPVRGSIQQIGTVDQHTQSGTNTAGVQGNVTNQNQTEEQNAPGAPKQQKTK